MTFNVSINKNLEPVCILQSLVEEAEENAHNRLKSEYHMTAYQMNEWMNEWIIRSLVMLPKIAFHLS